LIAAVGASAGGVEAFTELLTNLPADTGMAFVLIQHLDPKHQSLLSGLLAKKCTMPVVEVTKGMRLEPNRVYVIPPNATMTVADHSLQLEKRSESGGKHMPVDLFMRSLAARQGVRAIGVILSGSGTGGTLGMAEIQAHGGVTFAQDESSARYDGMPRSVTDAGCVDYILPPKSIAHELARIARHPYVTHASSSDSAEIPVQQGNGLATVFQLLRRSTGLHFAHYRQTTILRRIQRRMVVHKIDKLEHCVRFLQANPNEIKALYQDMLINVTSFFRNLGVFEAMRTQVFPEIVKGRRSDHP
jgi:two-component system, chemotaxis family, CheB/CheR fusion protein